MWLSVQSNSFSSIHVKTTVLTTKPLYKCLSPVLYTDPFGAILCWRQSRNFC